MEKVIRIQVRCGYVWSLRNLVKAFSGGRLKGPNFIEVEETKDGVFEVVGNNFTCEKTVLGFFRPDVFVQDLDQGQCDPGKPFDMSCHLRWQDVEMTPYRFLSPSSDRLKLALSRVVYCLWDLDDP